MLGYYFFSLQNLDLGFVGFEAQAVATNHVEEKEKRDAHQDDYFKGAVARIEQLKQRCYVLVLLLAVLKLGLDVLKELHFTHTEHNAKAHADAESRLLLLRRETPLDECKEHIEDYGEGEAPVNFEIRVDVFQLDAAAEPGVLTPAVKRLQAIVRDFYLLELLQVGIWIGRWVVQLLLVLEGLVDLVQGGSR